MYKSILTFTILTLFSLNLSGQYENPDNEADVPDKKQRASKLDDRLFFGGYVGLSFGSHYANVELSPLAGYKITPRFWAGAGPMYLYNKYIDINGEYKISLYGIKTFAQFNILDNIQEKVSIGIGSIFIYGENEILYSVIKADYITYPDQTESHWIDIGLAGFGLRFPLGSRSGMSVYCLWDLTQSAYYRYDNPVIRLGFDF